MTYQEAVDYIDKYGKEMSFEEEKGEYIVYIAPSDLSQLEKFNRYFFLNNFDPEIIQSFKNQDVCVMRGYKKKEPQNAFYYERIAR